MSDIRNVYVDNAATTPVAEWVLDAMIPFYKEVYGNASSVYKKGREARTHVEEARAKVAKAIGAKLPNEIYFTGSGTEADNWAIKGVAYAAAAKGKKHIITTVFEHHAVLHAAEALEKDGFEVTYIKVDSEGLVNLEDIKNALRDDTALVSIMYANNEIGTIQPIAEIGALCKERKVLFHTDAVQAISNVEIDVVAQNIDLLSMSAHKLNGPKGVGALYIRNGVPIANLIDGGAQERSKRPGTENVAGIVALGVAIEHATANMKENIAHKLKLRDKYIDGILSSIPRSRLNGSREKRLPMNANISFEGVEGEALLLMLDMKGVSASSGSACTSGSLDPSHVLLSIGLPHEIAHGSVRVSFGIFNTEEDVDYLLEVMPEIVSKLRLMSPVWENIIKNDK